MKTQTESMFIALHPDGTFRGASVTRLIVDDDGNAIASRQYPLDQSEVAAAFAAFNTQMLLQRDQLALEVAELTQERDLALAARELTATQLVEVQAELDSIKNPPNPFPGADWATFRGSVLSDPAVQRIALGNQTAWPLMVLYLSQLSTHPERATDIAQLWSLMELNTPIQSDEIARLNTIAETCNVPLRLNDDGSIG